MIQRAVAALLIGVVAAGTARAQEIAVQRSRITYLDNDYFVFSRPPNQRSDDNYTYGVGLRVTARARSNRITGLLCDKSSACAVSFSLGQEMYTPTEEDTLPIPGQRPHAGWLYAGVDVQKVRRDRLVGVGLVVGTTGPNSRADDVQFWIHAMEPLLRQPLGWDHQLTNEVAYGANVWVQEVRSVGDRQRWGVDFVPHASATVGTFRASAASGVTMRAGWGIRHPWVKESASIYGLYFRARVGGEVIGHSMLLAGNSNRASVSVPRLAPVMELERGIGLRMLKLLVEYSVTARSREYRGGPAVHRYGRFTATWLY